MVHLPDSDTDFFDIDTEVLQEDTFESYMCIVPLDYAPLTLTDK